MSKYIEIAFNILIYSLTSLPPDYYNLPQQIRILDGKPVKITGIITSYLDYAILIPPTPQLQRGFSLNPYHIILLKISPSKRPYIDSSLPYPKYYNKVVTIKGTFIIKPVYDIFNTFLTNYIINVDDIQLLSTNNTNNSKLPAGNISNTKPTQTAQ